ncbi:RNA cytidine acetyltransferase-like [Uloborus diversus]|uniref:RNA cytidine acetyltransferase-like n=1 Tax=Uloborus diversus TaxID=327109 RepID=UPI002409790D|nr:RNA cytidine acetyltransferase-like [Uloborus diversus]
MSISIASNAFTTEEKMSSAVAPCISTKHKYDSSKVLGQTFDVLIVEDFNGVTPNILARIIECVRGGGMVIMLFPTIQRLQDLADLEMDVHSHYCTYSHSEVIPRFNKRLVLSLMSCGNCLVLNDDLKVLLLPSNSSKSCSSSIVEMKSDLKKTLETNGDKIADDVKAVFHLCCTSEQVTALVKFNEALNEKLKNVLVSLTSARGRGKSATLGLSVSIALFSKVSNVCVIAPHLENVQTLFTFLVKGLKALSYDEDCEYVYQYNETSSWKLMSGVKLLKRKQKVFFAEPTSNLDSRNIDLIVIDEAAAIPLPLVKKLIISEIVFLASTINGYEGTGRSLSLKLIYQLRNQCQSKVAQLQTLDGRERAVELHEITLNEAVRYSTEDKIELWLNNLFCLDVSTNYMTGKLPEPEECELYYVNRDTLFSYHKTAEKFLKNLVALFVSSHYKNSPNDLLMMADAPAHHIFCLTPPVNRSSSVVPEILCAIQICFEGKLPVQSLKSENSCRKRASGDLIPWIIFQQFQDESFPIRYSARIVRIATHPDCNRMGYGRKALQLLCKFYEEKANAVDESKNCKSDPKKKMNPESNNSINATNGMKNLPPLLSSLNEIEADLLDYIGVSYGLTEELFRFWKKCDFLPLYLRQTKSEVTGEHSCIMIKNLQKASLPKNDWLSTFYTDFIQRFLALLPSAFRNLPATLVLDVLHYSNVKIKNLVTCELQHLMTHCSIQRLEAYASNLVDYHLIMDLLPAICRFYFSFQFKEYFLSSIQEAVLISLGLQNKTIEGISMELNIETNKVMGVFLKTMKKILFAIKEIQNCGVKRTYEENGHNDAERKKKKIPKPTNEKRYIHSIAFFSSISCLTITVAV